MMLYNSRYDLVNQVLLGAVDILERDGWCQLTTRDVLGRYCVSSAIMAVAWVPSLTRSLAMKKLQDHVNQPVMMWNDDPWRTKEQVISTLQTVATN